MWVICDLVWEGLGSGVGSEHCCFPIPGGKEGGRPRLGSQWGQRFPHLVPSKNIELVVSLGQKSPEQGGCPQWGPLTVSLWSRMSFFSGQLLMPCLLTLAERPQL